MATSGTKQSIDDYVLTEKLGSGTYATVYKAYKKSGSREVVALKCVQVNSLNKISTDNLLTEIELLKKLKHDNIVHLKDFMWDSSNIYLIMEFCSGGDLSHFIQSRRILSEKVAKRFLQQIASALHYMRSENVSHMDLKPSNILLSSSDRPILKIADFGFAMYLHGETEAAILRGSPLYMAPEIITKRFYNEKADLWSVGVILYECLFGKPPFLSKTLRELEDKILDDKPIELPYGVSVSATCRDLLHGLLQRDPQQRMSYDAFLSHPFVDLEHAPSVVSLDKAREFVGQAVIKDKDQDYKSAIPLYCQALQHFVAAIHYEKNSIKKEALRAKVKEYMCRTEELKRALKPQRPKQPSLYYTTMRSDGSRPESRSNSSSSPRTSSSLPTSSDQSLREAWHDHQALIAAIIVLESAEMDQVNEDYEGAMHKYELALESVLKILKDEPKNERRKILQREIARWMEQAEAVKNYLNVKDLKTQNFTSQDDEDNDPCECKCSNAFSHTLPTKHVHVNESRNDRDLSGSVCCAPVASSSSLLSDSLL